MSNLPGRPLLLLPYVLPTLAYKYTFLLLAFYISRYLLSIQLEAWGWNRSIEQHILEGDDVSAWFCKLWLRLMFAKYEGSSGTAPPPAPPAHQQDGEFTLKLHKRMQIYHLMQIWRNLLARQVLLLSICEANVKQSQRLLIDWKRCYARSWLSPGLEVICQLLSGACY